MKLDRSLIVLFLLGIALTQYGCAQQCAVIQTDYKAALAAEQSLVDTTELATGMPTHIGVALRTDVVGDVARQLIQKALQDKLGMTTNLPVGAGKNIKVKLDGDALNLKFEPTDACDTCFKLAGDLGGNANITAGLLGNFTVPLNGTLNLVAPINFATQDNGEVKVLLDLQKAGDYANSFVTMDLKGLPEAVKRLIKQPLTQEFMKQLTGKLEPLNLLTFKLPELGIKGLKLFPSEIGYRPEQRALFVGFTSNLPGIASGQGLDATKALAFGADENLAVAIQPGIIANAVSVLIQNGTIPRRYSLQGAAQSDGPAHVTMQSVQFGQAAEATNDPVDIGFRSWVMNNGLCFWFDALVTGAFSLEEKRLKVDLQQIKLVNASIAPELMQGIEQWKSAEFLGQTKNLIETSLNEPSIELPNGTSFTLAPSSFASDDRTITLRSIIKVKLATN